MSKRGRPAPAHLRSASVAVGLIVAGLAVAGVVAWQQRPDPGATPADRASPVAPASAGGESPAARPARIKQPWTVVGTEPAPPPAPRAPEMAVPPPAPQPGADGEPRGLGTPSPSRGVREPLWRQRARHY